jgi:acetyl-CoA synthetase
MSYPYQITSLEQYYNDYKKSMDDPEGFWGNVAQNFEWDKKWDKVLNWDFKEPKIECFANAKLNISKNCLDRNLERSGDTPAIIWEPNDPAEKNRTKKKK